MDLGRGTSLRVLPALAARLCCWNGGNFRALLPVGLDFETMEKLQNDRSLKGVTALLLADCGYVPLNKPEWVDSLHPQVVLLSVGGL